MDYDKFLSKVSKRRQPNLIRLFTEAYMKNPNALFFASGLPNAELFPFQNISVNYDGTNRKLSDAELLSALQYGPLQGHLPLVKKWREYQKKWHSPKYDNWDVIFTSGSMDGCSKIFEMLIEEDQPVMTQSPTYTGILGALLPMQPDLILLNMDEDGILPSDVVKVYEERLQSGKSLPKLLYVNPTGANPTGIVYTNSRKQEIYELAQKYDFLIVEDDAYYFIHFLDEQPRSFLSYDVDGRVLRLDSFSKIMSPGLRLGTVTAPLPFIEKLNLHIACTTVHASSLSQVLVLKCLNSWSESDLEANFIKIRKFYRKKRDIMVKAVEKYFTGIAEWSVPRGGIFMWLKVTVLEDVHDLIMRKCIPMGVFVLPGHAFYPDSNESCPYFRLSYSHANTDEVNEGLSRIAAIIREVQAATKVSRMK